MLYKLGCPRILDAARQTLGQAQLPLDLRQHQHAGIRGQATAVEGDVNRLAAHRLQAREQGRMLRHGGCELR